MVTGDLLLRLDGEDVISLAQVRELEASRPPQASIRLEGLRGGVPFTAQLTLQQRPRLETGR